MPSLGLAMIAQNEASHIPASIAQFYQAIDDIVLVDGGSKDDTIMWAKRMGARVFERPFDNDFSAQKNFAIDKLETDWIYLHDPDERLEPTVAEILNLLIDPAGQKYLQKGGVLPRTEKLFDCFGIARKNFIDGVFSEVYPDYQYRLFKNYCRFEGKVHEEVVGFENRTEVDFQRTSAEYPSRFNILHYKSNIRQAEQNALYECISKGEA